MAPVAPWSRTSTTSLGHSASGTLVGPSVSRSGSTNAIGASVSHSGSATTIGFGQRDLGSALAGSQPPAPSVSHSGSATTIGFGQRDLSSALAGSQPPATPTTESVPMYQSVSHSGSATTLGFGQRDLSSAVAGSQPPATPTTESVHEAVIEQNKAMKVTSVGDLECKVSEISGALLALQKEHTLQAQISNTAETRIKKWGAGFEREVRIRFAELKQELAKLTGESRGLKEGVEVGLAHLGQHYQGSHHPSNVSSPQIVSRGLAIAEHHEAHPPHEKVIHDARMARLEHRVAELEAGGVAGSSAQEIFTKIGVLGGEAAANRQRIETLACQIEMTNSRLDELLKQGGVVAQYSGAGVQSRSVDGDRIEAMKAELASRLDRVEAMKADFAPRLESVVAMRAELFSRLDRVEAMKADFVPRLESVVAMKAEFASRIERIETQASVLYRQPEVDRETPNHVEVVKAEFMPRIERLEAEVKELEACRNTSEDNIKRKVADSSTRCMSELSTLAGLCEDHRREVKELETRTIAGEDHVKRELAACSTRCMKELGTLAGLCEDHRLAVDDRFAEMGKRSEDRITQMKMDFQHILVENLEETNSRIAWCEMELRGDITLRTSKLETYLRNLRSDLASLGMPPPDGGDVMDAHFSPSKAGTPPVPNSLADARPPAPIVAAHQPSLSSPAPPPPREPGPMAKAWAEHTKRMEAEEAALAAKEAAFNSRIASEHDSEGQNLLPEYFSKAHMSEPIAGGCEVSEDFYMVSEPERHHPSQDLHSNTPSLAAAEVIGDAEKGAAFFTLAEEPGDINKDDKEMTSTPVTSTPPPTEPLAATVLQNGTTSVGVAGD